MAGRYYGVRPCDVGEGGDAKIAELSIGRTGGFTVAPDGNIYLNEGVEGHYMCQLRKITPDGKIYMMTAGLGDYYCYNGNFSEGAISWQVRLYSLGNGIQAGPGGSLYFTRKDSIAGDYTVKRLDAGYSGIGLNQYAIPDGPAIHIFNHDGKHQRTISAKTGATLRSFGYGPSGHIVSITDGDGNVTSIERDAQGRAAAIVGPYGHRTAFTLDADGNLASITNPANEAHQLTYQPGGLLTHFRTPRGFDHVFTYDENGRLTLDQDPAGGSTALARTGTFADSTVTRTSAEGRAHRYQTQNQVLPRGKRTNHTFPDGTGTTRDELLDGQRAFYTSEWRLHLRCRLQGPAIPELSGHDHVFSGPDAVRPPAAEARSRQRGSVEPGRPPDDDVRVVLGDRQRPNVRRELRRGLAHPDYHEPCGSNDDHRGRRTGAPRVDHCAGSDTGAGVLR